MCTVFVNFATTVLNIYSSGLCLSRFIEENKVSEFLYVNEIDFFCWRLYVRFLLMFENIKVYSLTKFTFPILSARGDFRSPGELTLPQFPSHWFLFVF